MAIRSLMFALIFVLGGFGCATGRGRYSVVDRIPAKQSSYRIRGTNVTGVLSPYQRRMLQSKTRSWRWPTDEVIVTSGFGARGNEHHDGVDLRARSGTPVSAAADGRVIYAGAKIRGYGRMIVIRHPGKLSTIYAHNSKLLVRTGQNVRRGQRIALSGSTGHSSGPHVHFEVREGITAIDPMVLMPPPAIANEANRRIIRAMRGARRHVSSARYSQSSAARVAVDDGFRPRSPLRSRSD